MLLIMSQIEDYLMNEQFLFHFGKRRAGDLKYFPGKLKCFLKNKTDVISFQPCTVLEDNIYDICLHVCTIRQLYMGF